MKYFILILLMLSFVSASCVNINSASLEELDEIVGVGPVTAQKIIDARPFSSIDDLVKVNGIAEKKLANIKTEGLACVDGDVDEEIGEEKEIVLDKLEEENVVLPEKTPIVLSLNDDAGEKLIYVSKNSKVIAWLPYGFALFLIFIIVVLLWEKY